MKHLKLTTLLFMFIVCYACSEGTLEPPQSTTPPVGNLPTDDEVTYSGKVSSILSANCTGCHGADNPRAGLSLHTYATAKNGTENSSVLSRIRDTNNPMPQGGLMAEEDIKAIEDWAAGGYQE